MLGFLRDGAYAFRLTTLVRDDLPPLCIIMAILALDYVMRKEAKKNSVLRSTTSARMQRKQLPEDEPLKSLSLAAEKYLPCTKDQAKYHQRDFREQVQSDRSRDGRFPSIHSNLVPR